MAMLVPIWTSAPMVQTTVPVIQNVSIQWEAMNVCALKVTIAFTAIINLQVLHISQYLFKVLPEMVKLVMI